MSTLQVANLHFESTGNNRLQYIGSNSFNLVAGSANVATINSTSFNLGPSIVMKNNGVNVLPILQMVTATTNTKVDIDSNVLVNTGLSATITPSSANNKILILTNQPSFYGVNNTKTYVGCIVQLQRGANNIGAVSTGFTHNANGGGGMYGEWTAIFCHLDSPNTTSPVTYKTQFRMTYDNNAGEYASINISDGLNQMSSMHLLEIVV